MSTTHLQLRTPVSVFPRLPLRRLTVLLFAAFILFVAGCSPRAFDLIKDGKPASRIVLPNPCTDLQQQGAETLVKYLKMASGAELPIVKEGERVEGALVSFGPTRMAIMAGVDEKHLKWDGYHMVVKKGVLYLLGRDEKQLGGTGAQGSRRVALALLERFGFRWLQPTPMGTYVPDLKTVSVPDDLNVTYEPPLMYMNLWPLSGKSDWAQANSFREAVKIVLGPDTWTQAVPAGLFETHPEYFRMQDGHRVQPTQNYPPQYCPSNVALRQLIANWVIGKFGEGYEAVVLGQSDGFLPCKCPTCSKIEPDEQIREAERDIIRRIRLVCPHGKIHLLVYFPTQAPPKTFKRYPRRTAGLVCLTGALKDEFGSFDRALHHWNRALTGGLTVFSYSLDPYTTAGISPHFTPRLAATLMTAWRKNSVNGIFWDPGAWNWGAEGPAYYVIGRLATDPATDWRQAYEEYISLTFGKAAPAMKKYYEILYARIDDHRSTDTVTIPGRKCSGDYFMAVYPEDVLKQLNALLKDAEVLAAGDVRALAWIHLAEFSYDQYALIASGFHVYQAYLLSPTNTNLERVQAAVDAYFSWTAGVTSDVESRSLATDYFPSFGYWRRSELKTNYGHLKCAPFDGGPAGHSSKLP